MKVANRKNRPLKKPSVQQIAPYNRAERLHLTIHIALYSYHFNRAPHPSHKLPLVTNLFRLRFFTARKRSLGQGNIFTPVCHSVHGGRAWLLGGVRGCSRGVCGCSGGCGSSQGGVHGCSRGHAWLLQGGVHGCSQGACMVAPGGVRGCSQRGMHGHDCSWGACVVAPGGGHAWDTTRYGDTINERAVRILLGCILVNDGYYHQHGTGGRGYLFNRSQSIIVPA